MVGGDEPQLQVQVVVPLLHADEVEDVVVLHAAHAVDLILVLPRQLVLHESRDRRYFCYSKASNIACGGKVVMSAARNMFRKSFLLVLKGVGCV